MILKLPAIYLLKVNSFSFIENQSAFKLLLSFTFPPFFFLPEANLAVQSGRLKNAKLKRVDQKDR